MSLRTDMYPGPGVERPDDPRAQGLLTLIRARLIVVTLALPIGVLLRPDAGEPAWWVLWWSLLAIGVFSALYWLAVRLGRAYGFQTYLQVGVDIALVSTLAALTGGRESQFVLLYALVVITGGLLARLPGGVFAALGAGASFAGLPRLATSLGATPDGQLTGPLPPPGMMIAFLATMGVLSGVLGSRVHHAHAALERTTRELDRVRVDNDVVLRHLTSGVLTVDGRGEVAYLNPAAEQVLGLESERVCGRPLAGALPERLTALRELVARTVEERTPRIRAEVLVRNQSEAALPLGVSTNLLMHEGEPTGVVAVFQDLTEAREMERRVRRNETLAEVGALAAGIAHELRNGLNPISGSVEYLQRELKLEGETQVLMELIAHECNRLNRFVTDLLGYSRERDLALAPLDLEEHLAELCDGLRRDPRCPASITVQYEAAHRPCLIEGDREQLRQVWLNLAYNALEAMSSGGTLNVRWREDERQRAVVEFVDTGPGIAATDLPHVGQPFFTTKEGGTGLGVAIAQRIVERHGGALGYESAPGRGTAARVVLPSRMRRTALAA